MQLKVTSCRRIVNHHTSSKSHSSDDAVGQLTSICMYLREGARALELSIFCSKKQKLLLVEQKKPFYWLS